MPNTEYFPVSRRTVLLWHYCNLYFPPWLIWEVSNPPGQSQLPYNLSECVHKGKNKVRLILPILCLMSWVKVSSHLCSRFRPPFFCQPKIFNLSSYYLIWIFRLSVFIWGNYSFTQELLLYCYRDHYVWSSHTYARRCCNVNALFVCLIYILWHLNSCFLIPKENICHGKVKLKESSCGW